MPYCSYCRRETDHHEWQCVYARQAKQQAAEHREVLAEQRQRRRAEERRAAREEHQAKREELTRKMQDAHSKLLHHIDKALRENRELADEDPGRYYLFALDLQRRVEEMDVTRLAPEERHVHGDVLERIEKRLRVMKKKEPELVEELDAWVFGTRKHHEAEAAVKYAVASLARYRENNYIEPGNVPSTSAEAQQAVAVLDQQIAEWRASCPPQPSAAGVTFVSDLRRAGICPATGVTYETIAREGTAAYATAVRRWGPHGPWGQVGFPAARAMLQSTVLLLVMAGGAWFFISGPEVALACVVIAVFTACFGFVRLVQEKSARQIAADAVCHYESWTKEIEKLSGERSHLDDLRAALAAVEESRETAGALDAWAEEYPDYAEAVVQAAVGDQDEEDEAEEQDDPFADVLG